jgi:trans-aconitate methyltransferase
MTAMTTTHDLASIPAADIALLGGGRLATLDCTSGRSIVDIALAYPEALVDGFDGDGDRIAAARAEATAVRLTGRIAFRHVDPAQLRAADLPVYDVVVTPKGLRDVAARLISDAGVVVVQES